MSYKLQEMAGILIDHGATANAMLGLAMVVILSTNFPGRKVCLGLVILTILLVLTIQLTYCA